MQGQESRSDSALHLVVVPFMSLVQQKQSFGLWVFIWLNLEEL